MKPLNIGFSTGFAELNNYWGDWPINGKQMGGSENLVVSVAEALAQQGHDTSVRLPYQMGTREILFRGVRYLSDGNPSCSYDILFCVDDYAPKDSAERRVLVACRSDPPRHLDYHQRSYFSATHARLMGDEGAAHIGGGVWLDRYRVHLPRVPNRVIYTSSPDRGGHHAAVIGRDFDFVATYRGCNELSGEELRRLQQSAMVTIHPYDAPRESEFFCMSVLEALAAGTPTVLSDGPALVELWGEAAMILSRPIDYSQWSEAVQSLMEDPEQWAEFSAAGKKAAERYDWPLQAQRYLELALS